MTDPLPAARSLPVPGGASRPTLSPTLSYVICTAPRTGSSLLAAALARTGVAGHPAEYFDIHARNEDAWRRSLAIGTEDEYLDKVVAAGSTPNGVFGFKLHQHQIPALRPRLERGTPEAGEAASLDALLRARLGDVRYIWLRRRSKLSQGVSYSRASLTNEWRRVAGRPGERAPEPAFDLAHVERHVRLAHEFDARWLAFFRQNRVPALVLFYEDFIQSYAVTVRGVLRFLGLPDAAPIAPPAFERQADDRSLDWERRYAEAQAAPASAPVAAAALPTPALAAPAPPAPPAEEPGTPLSLVAYDISGRNGRRIVTAPVGRAWMDATPRRFAYRCLPMLIANQAGWLVLNTQRILVSWDGRETVDAVKVESLGDGEIYVADSHFGSGIVTFHMGYLFRTPPGYNLHVRGPANSPKDGIHPLEGIVESDWSDATFTMNWKLTRPNHAVVFERDEPIAMITPVRRGELERFQPSIRNLRDEPALRDGYTRWSRSRDDFNAGLKQQGSDAQKAGWQRHYLRGHTVSAQQAPEHQTGLAVSEFLDGREGRDG